MNPYQKYDFRKYIASIPSEEIQRQNLLQIERDEQMYQEFAAAMDRGMCFLCGQPNDSFFPKRFCFHWFIYPSGIRKKHFSQHLNGPVHFFRLDAYLRWLATYEKPIVNINDLTDEISQSSYIETTIRYKKIEWAFSIGHTDMHGHKNSKAGGNPHYHLQMTVDDRIFLRFNDFHIEFTDEDLFALEMRDQAGDLIDVRAYRGEGIGILEDPEVLKYLAEHTTVADDEDTAPFQRETLIEAPEGETISGDLIAQAAEESKRTKEPIGRIMQRLLPKAKITTVLSPGDGIPTMTKRSGKK